MKVARIVLAILFILSSSPNLSSQQALVLERDAQAVSLLSQSIAAMGTTVPSDSTTSGTVTITAGGESCQGSVRVLTRGTNQSSIQFQAPMATWSLIFSKGQASKIDSTGTSTSLPLELAMSSQSLYFPLPFLAGLFNNPDVSLQYIGPETLGSSAVNHLRAWNTFNSNPQMQFLSDFTFTDIWLDATSGSLVKSRSPDVMAAVPPRKYL